LGHGACLRALSSYEKEVSRPRPKKFVRFPQAIPMGRTVVDRVNLAHPEYAHPRTQHCLVVMNYKTFFFAAFRSLQ